MATKLYESNLDSPTATSPRDSLNDHEDHSWYRHSGHTGDFHGPRSAVPSLKAPSAFLDGASTVAPAPPSPKKLPLVAELQHLRREVESKNELISTLESSLQATQSDTEAFARRLDESQHKASEADARLRSLTTDLVEERDAAVNAHRSLKAQFDQLAHESRAREENVARWQIDWQQKDRLWAQERTALEQRVHSTEAQLRDILDDLRSRRFAGAGNPSLDQRGMPAASESSTPGRNSPSDQRKQSAIGHHATGFSSFVSFTTIDSQSPPAGSQSNGSNVDASDTGKSVIRERHVMSLDGKEVAGNGSYEFYGDSDDEKISTPSPETTMKARKILGIDAPATHSKHAHKRSEYVVPMKATLRDIPPQRPQLKTKLPQPNPTAMQNTWTPVAPKYDPQIFALSAAHQGSSPIAELESPATYFPRHEYIAELPATRFSACLPASITVDAPSDAGAHGQPIEEDSGAKSTQSVSNEQSPGGDHLPLPTFSLHPATPRHSAISRSMIDAGTQTEPITSSRDAGIQTEEIRLDIRRFKGFSLDLVEPLTTTRPASVLSNRLHEVSGTTQQSEDLVPRSLEHRAIRDTVNRSNIPTASTASPSISTEIAENMTKMWGSQSSIRAAPAKESGSWRRSGGSDLVSPNKPLSRSASATIASLQHADEAFERFSPRQVPSSRSYEAFTSSSSSLPRRTFSQPARARSVKSLTSQVPPVPPRSSSRIHGDLIEEDSDYERSFATSVRRSQSAMSSHSARMVKSPRGDRPNSSAQSLMSTSLDRRPALKAQSSLMFDERRDRYDATEEMLSSQIPPSRSASRMELQPAEDEERDENIVHCVTMAISGQYMWKYSQKRTSLSKFDNRASEWDNAHSARQKRWIWVSPHDQSIMWASKQPGTGSSLLSKSSRKLTIKTVLDVKDDNPLPKASVYMTFFDRSIIILGPQRQLKFTATSKENHYAWLKALTYISSKNRAHPRLLAGPSGEVQNIADYQTGQPDRVLGQSINKVNGRLLSQSRSFSTPILIQNDAALPYSPADDISPSPGLPYARPGTIYTGNHERTDSADTTMTWESSLFPSTTSYASTSTFDDSTPAAIAQRPSTATLRPGLVDFYPARPHTAASMSRPSTQRSGSMMRMTAFARTGPTVTNHDEQAHSDAEESDLNPDAIAALDMEMHLAAAHISRAASPRILVSSAEHDLGREEASGTQSFYVNTAFPSAAVTSQSKRPQYSLMPRSVSDGSFPQYHHGRSPASIGSSGASRSVSRLPHVIEQFGGAQ